ncbi:MAG: protein phosphatase 2C domain-containing protein [Pseudonocardiaceae bacterium]
MDEPCPHCAEPIRIPDQFCEACGADRGVHRSGTISTAGADRSCHGCGLATGAPVEYCPQCGLRLRDGTDHVESDLGMLAGVSDRGHGHARNEDAMALGYRKPMGHRTPMGQLAAVVCDGVSTVHSPELASRAAVEVALDVLLGAGNAPAEQRSRDAVAAAARAVSALPAPSARNAPSCTLVSALVDRTAPEITVAWVGDSRAYWLAEAGAAEPARRLTTDHSWAAEMVAAGRLDVPTAMADARAHAITHWLGAGGEPEPGVVTLRPAGSGVLLLCSDGLWNYLPDAEELAAVTLPAVTLPAIPLPAITQGSGSLDAAAALTAVALARGGHDNITVVVIPITVRSPS